MIETVAPIRVMTVDDSPTIRRLIAAELAMHSDIECLDGGSHPYEARERIKAAAPDVLILDIDMPHMNGLDFLRKIMTLRPMPVLMFSSHTASGSQRAIEALEIGAIDVLAKSQKMATDGTLGLLPDMIRMASRVWVSAPENRPELPVARGDDYRNRNAILMIGSSTGGVDALERVLSEFPVNCPPTLISQHMPKEFLRNFALRINQISRPVVKIAEDGEPLVDGMIYIAPGGEHHLAIAPGAPCRCYLDPQAKVSGHRPSVDVMFRSAVPLARRVVSVLLTGMGSDGARGMKDLRDAGARTLVQNEATCVVFGMPRVALELGAAQRSVPLDQIASAVLDLCARRVSQTA